MLPSAAQPHAIVTKADVNQEAWPERLTTPQKLHGFHILHLTTHK